MNNPFELISARLSNIESLLLDIKHKPHAKMQEQPDRCTFAEALEVTGLSKSKLYKLTSENAIPCKRYGNRLIFGRRELTNWVESQTVEKHDTGSTAATLARSARAKNKQG